MSDFILICDNNVTFPMTTDERDRFKKKRGTTGRNHPFFIFDDGTEIFMDKVIAIKAEDYVKVSREKPTILEIVPPVVDEIPEKKDKLITREQDLRNQEAEFIAKAECKHEDVTLNFHETKKGKRFFPVCDFCGHRGRYIASDSLTDVEKKEAVQWIEK